ncbi:hypothetical protein KKB41_04035 [Patescibacteria group bacterium]|nr:hypothetical protein [Patescibacteria group bacterium]
MRCPRCGCIITELPDTATKANAPAFTDEDENAKADDGGFAILTNPWDNFPDLCKEAIPQEVREKIKKLFSINSDN